MFGSNKNSLRTSEISELCAPVVVAVLLESVYLLMTPNEEDSMNEGEDIFQYYGEHHVETIEKVEALDIQH